MSAPSRPKFFKLAAAAEADGGFRILLDGKSIKTPKGKPLAVPARALAEALAAEWNALEDKIEPDRLPLTKLVNTALDGTANNRGLMLEDLRRYAGTDLICYRAEGPEALVAREAESWDPLLVWAKETLGADIAPCWGIVHQTQSPEAVEALVRAVEGLDDLALTALHLATALTGSLIIALALTKGRLDAETAWAATQVDEIFQQEKWGVDAEAQIRAEHHFETLRDAERLMRLVAP